MTVPADVTSPADAQPAQRAQPAASARRIDPLRVREAARIWPAAAAVAGLGALICLFATPGLNWGLWTLAAAGGLLVARGRPAGRPSLALATVLACACTLAFATAVTADMDVYPLILLGTVVLLAVAMLLAGGAPVGHVGARAIVLAPLVGGTDAVREAVGRIADGVAITSSGRTVRGLRGAVIALPIVAVLALLLSAADPVLARVRDDVMRLMDDSTVAPRLVFWAALGAFCLGVYGIAARREASVPGVAAQRAGLRLDASERLIILWSVSGLFALFLGLQLSYLFGNVAALAGSGVTYAESARRGFGELTVAASISAVLVLWLDTHAARGDREARVRLAALALLLLVQLLLDSAYHRVVLYEAAYGYSAARLYARVYMVIVSLALIALGVEVWGRIDVRRLARRVALAGVVALIALSYWNHEAWIARRNLARYATTGQVDEDYLVRGLSPNAVPAIVRALPSLPAPEATRLRAALDTAYANSGLPHRARWYEANVRQAQAQRALTAIGIR